MTQKPDEMKGNPVEYRRIVAVNSQASVAEIYDGGRNKWAVLTRNRYVFGAALLCALGLPYAFFATLSALRSGVLDIGFLVPTYAAAGLAILIGHFSLRRISGLPLASAGSLVFPAFFASYGGAFFGLYAMRAPLSLTHFGASFLCAIGWYLFISIIKERHLRPVIGLIGVSPAIASGLSRRANWLILREPTLPKGLSAVAYDPHKPLSMRWSSFITRLVLQSVPVYHLTHIEEGLTGKVRFNHHSENDFGALLPSLFYLRLKRFLDLTSAIVLLPIVGPVILAAAVLVRLEGPGRAIFKQIRIGHRGRPFVCLKLRTMREDAEGPAFTVESDPRITRLGHYLRKWRIDELPQIFNIIRGDMSWIGPRPEAASLAREYARCVPFYGYRHAVRPGITGWAAVHQGNVAQVEAAKEKLEYDFYYIRYFSVWLDALIVFKTVQTVLTGFGSR